MKKFIFTLLLIPMVSLAGLDVPKVDKTLAGLTSKKPLTYFSASDKIRLSGNFTLAPKNKADILLFSKSQDKKKMLIVNSYKELKNNKNSIGAIYLKKGRTQIVFVKERLDKNNLILKDSLKKHLINTWQLDKVSLLHQVK